MNNFSPATPSPTPSLRYSLVDWLVLGGVLFETGEETAFEAHNRVIAAQMARTTTVSEETLPVQTLAKPATKATDLPIPALPEFQSLPELNEYCRTFKEMGICRTASGCVLGLGPLSPRVMVITDMPEDQEDRSGIAFSSPANQMIRKALGLAGFAETDHYVTCLSKWRPPGKRTLTPQETALCAALLKQEIRLVRPAAILTLGESTIRAMLPDSLTGGLKPPFINIVENHIVDYRLPFMASQKGEFLVKNMAMKKNFWFSLLDFAATTRT